MNLIRLPATSTPPPSPRTAPEDGLGFRGRLIGQVANLYVDDDRELQFVDVVIGGFLGLGTKHHLVPVEAIAEEGPGSITLTVDQQTVESAPTLDDPHAAPDEDLQRAAREHCGLAAASSEP